MPNVSLSGRVRGRAVRSVSGVGPMPKARDVSGERRFHVIPLSKTTARQFIQEHHRHNEAPSQMQVMFAVGLIGPDGMIGCATAGRPVARLLDDGLTLEVSRVCVLEGNKNANSMLYGSIRRAATALGYRRLVTYTLPDESGASLRAVGFTDPIDIRIRSWQDGSKVRVRHDVNLWGERKMTQNVPKLRWDMDLSA